MIAQCCALNAWCTERFQYQTIFLAISHNHKIHDGKPHFFPFLGGFSSDLMKLGLWDGTHRLFCCWSSPSTLLSLIRGSIQGRLVFRRWGRRCGSFFQIGVSLFFHGGGQCRSIYYAKNASHYGKTSIWNKLVSSPGMSLRTSIINLFCSPWFFSAVLLFCLVNNPSVFQLLLK